LLWLQGRDDGGVTTSGDTTMIERWRVAPEF
jgi:hypothetical protein